jgi:hypothetical protein
MDKRTLAALQGSIKKWEGIVAGTGKDEGIYNCPLCTVFLDEGAEEGEQVSCYGCPVSIAVQNTGCEDTPYDEWADHQNIVHAKAPFRFPCFCVCPECTRLAQIELDFLKSLLPRTYISTVQIGSLVFHIFEYE